MSLFPAWHYCMQSEELEDSKITEVHIGHHTICLLRQASVLTGFAALCPHAGARLCNGRIDNAGRIVCPLHQYRFNPINGHNTSGEGYKLKTYKVKEEDGKIFVFSF